MSFETLVVGAGVAGLAAAIALRQRGLPVRLVERSAGTPTRGAGFVLWPNGRRALDELVPTNDVARTGGAVRRLRRVTPHGATDEVLDFAAFARGTESAPGRSLLRTTLLGLLERRANELGVSVEYGRALDALEDDGERCWVRFADGARESADLVIGAEGRMDSRTRRFVTADDGDRPRYHGFVNWLGVFEGDVARLASEEILEVRARAARFGFVPLGQEQAYWAAIGPAAPDEPAEEVTARLHHELEATADPIPELLRASRERTPHVIWVHDLDPLERWHRGRVVLIGDAAHAALPSSGQGASQALVDAVELARRLPGRPRGLDAALTEFTQHRRPETTALTARARRDAEHTLTEWRSAQR
jgi:FAD-dependent urate hydroxylase